MGTDMTCHVEVKVGQDWIHVSECHPFDYRNYDLYGFLGNVNNYGSTPFLSDCRGIPEDVSANVRTELSDDSSAFRTYGSSWVLLTELLKFDYDKQFENLCPSGSFDEKVLPGQGEMTTMRELLGEPFFKDLDYLKAFCDLLIDEGLPGAECMRIVFWFD